MKIIVYSSTFLPNIGGLENIMAGLAEEWSAMGHTVIIYTLTDQRSNSHNFSFTINVKKSVFQLYKAVKKADIYIEANISLKNCLIGLCSKKKWFVVHHTPYFHQKKWSGILKNQLSKFAHNISVSGFIAKALGTPSTVIHNFYSPQFKRINFGKREYDFVFLGRMVSDKGVNKLLDAVIHMDATCLLIGDGPERAILEKLSENADRKNKIHFTGLLSGVALTNALNNSKVMVIPSIWEEPFGIVALEGLASGCIIACSDRSGLREATGGNAFLFDPEIPESMLSAMSKALVFEPDDMYHESVEKHLQRHTRASIAEQYIRFFENTCI